MKLKLFKSMWGFGGGLEDAILFCQKNGLNGIEGPPPAELAACRAMKSRLEDEGLEFIAEICTAVDEPGMYLPRREARAREHLESLKSGAERARECGALFASSMAGCDAWSVGQSVEFFGEAQDVTRGHNLTASFETHRGRSFYSPWVARDILLQVPELRITCDFSHWCVVCERLLDTEPEVLALCFGRAHHVHARVGYDQGPQAPDPSSPEHKGDLEAHQGWWSAIWDAHEKEGRAWTTMTPESGPDGYLHTLPHTRMPVADLDAVNGWVARRQRERFAARSDALFTRG